MVSFISSKHHWLYYYCNNSILQGLDPMLGFGVRGNTMLSLKVVVRIRRESIGELELVVVEEI